MTVTADARPDTAADVVCAFVHAVVTRDDDALSELLTEDVWLRALLPRSIVEFRDRGSVVATIRS